MKTKEITHNKDSAYSNRNPLQNLKIYICIGCILIFVPCTDIKAADNDTISPWSVLMAENLMENPSIAAGPALNYYVFATAMKGLRELFEVSGDSIVYHYIAEIVDDNLSYYEHITGLPNYDMDFINGASLILFMYSQTGDPKYIPAIDSTLKYLNSMPRTPDGGIYHKGALSYYRLQLDDLYMIGPFMAEYGKIFNKPEVYKDAVKQALLFDHYMRDTITGLMYHAWYDGSQGATAGCTPYFWGRGIGWVTMGLVDMLDFLPEGYSGRDSVIGMFQTLAKAVADVQDDKLKVWWQVLNMTENPSNYPESSASCMFVYSIAKGIKRGYLDNSFTNCIEKGMQGIMDNFLEIVDENIINITHLCPGQAPSFTLSQYFLGIGTNGHAVGPFIEANLETALLNINPVINVQKDKYYDDFSIAVYPNPFSGETTLSLCLPETEYITVDVFNIQGSKVKRLYQGIKPAGWYSFPFKPSDNINNAYICRLQAGNRIIIKKLIRFK